MKVLCLSSLNPLRSHRMRRLYARSFLVATLSFAGLAGAGCQAVLDGAFGNDHDSYYDDSSSYSESRPMRVYRE